MSITQQIIESKSRGNWVMGYDIDADIVDLIAQEEDEIKALNHSSVLQPDLILLSYDVRKEETEQLIHFLMQESANSKVLVIGEQLTERKILNCILAGANGYMDFSVLEKQIDKAIKVLLNGEAWITRTMAAILINELRK